MGDLKDGRLGSETMGALALHPLLSFALAQLFQKGIIPGSLGVEGQAHGSYRTGGNWVQWDLAPWGQQSVVLFNVCFWSA